MTEQDKQALIKHFCSRDCGEAAEGCMIMPCHEIELIQEFPTSEADSDTISRKAAIDALQKEINKAKPPFDDVIGSIRCGVRLARNIIEDLPSAQPEQHTCVNCGRTVNNGGWYADGRTRCPIEEHYALPKDGYCHLWEKRNVTDDDYPERREE